MEELYTLYVGDWARTSGLPLRVIPARAGARLEADRPGGESLYAVPSGDGRYDWATWTVAADRGWSERHGYRDYDGEELDQRFLVLYYPPPSCRWPAFWRQVERPPLRLEVCRNRGGAEWLAKRWVPRRQIGFRWWQPTRLVAVWGWDDRDTGFHPDCDAECGCERPMPGRPLVLIAEFKDESTAMRPDVRLEREAWLARLDAERAMALTVCPQRGGTCSSPCAHCDALMEEVDAAWEWRASHRREIRRWQRARRQAAQREAAGGPTC